jgi:ABC-type cobalamin/Fe3+-siderophores transport system ATPase subunit
MTPGEHRAVSENQAMPNAAPMAQPPLGRGNEPTGGLVPSQLCGPGPGGAEVPDSGRRGTPKTGARGPNGIIEAQRGGGSVGSALVVDEASYAYAADETAAPPFRLEPVSFAAAPAELVAILGPNASGKSTLLGLLAGSLKPLAGRVALDGAEVSALDARARARRIAVVRQESPLLFPMRALEYVLQGRHPYGRRMHLASPEDQALAAEALEQVGAAHLRDRWMDHISGGEKQRIVLARALAQQPLLLLLDEPTLHLDIGGQVELLERLTHLAVKRRSVVVVVTHELNLAAEFAGQVLLLHRGRCLRRGRPAEVFDEPLLREVFAAPLKVETGPNGRPRILLEERR